MRVIFIYLFLFMSSFAYSQVTSDDRIIFKDIDKMSEEKSEKKEKETETDDNIFAESDTITAIVERKYPDISNYYSECYLTVVNKNGMWQGIGSPLTKEQMRKTAVYYRLSKPHPKAPFTFMQVFNSLGNLSTNHSWAPYMANPSSSDDGIQYSWKTKLGRVCQFEKVFQKGVLIQENMYNNAGELVLQYIPSYISKDHIIGHYTDANGVLALLRKDEKCKYVSVRLDENGYVSQIAFIDEDGRLRRNGDNAFMQCYKNYDNGLVEYTYSGDMLGNPMIDNWGNCGWRYTYFDNGRSKTGSCVDAEFKPMRMPHKRNTTDVYNIRYKYDKWGNLIEGRYYNDKWEPDTATGGIHSYRITYKNGLRTSYATYGLDGKLADYDEDVAMWVNEFDRNGNLIFSKTLNKDSLFSTEETCLIICEYKNKKLVSRLEYMTTNGKDTTLSKKRFTNADGDFIYYYNNRYIKVYNYDLQGNPVLEAFYDCNMHPIDNIIGFHKKVSTFTAGIQEECFYDKDGNPVNMNTKRYWRDYNRHIIEIDSQNHIKIENYYDGNRLLKRYGNIYDKNFNYPNELFYCDSLGYRGRSFKADVLYYRAACTRSAIDGNVIMLSGLNEFGEPSYIMNGDWTNATIYCYRVMGDGNYLDENGDTIPKGKDQRIEFKNKLYKSFCIELVDSAAYRLGLRTGDIILRYGNWHYPRPSQYGGYWENMLCYESALQATTEKPIVVMRHNPETRTSELLQFTLPAGSPHEIGFIYHMLYMTQAEYTRYNNVVENNISKVELDSLNTEYAATYKVNFIKPCKVGDYSNKIVFQEGFQQNVILLAYVPYIDGKEYFFSAENNKNCDLAFDTEYDSIAVYYTVDAKTAKRHVFGRKGYKDGDFRNYIRRSNTDIPDGRVNSFLIDSLQAVYDTKYPPAVSSLSPREAAEELLKLPGTTTRHSNSSVFSGYDNGKFGDIKEEYYVSANLDSLSWQEYLYYKDIMRAVNFDDYVHLYSENDYLYTTIKNDKPNGTVRKTKNGIAFLLGDTYLHRMQLPTITCVDDGILKEHGIDGEYVLLQYNNWRFGMEYEVLNKERTARRNGKAELRMAIARINYDGENVSLGKIESYEFGKGVLGAFSEWKECPQSIIDEVLARMKKIQKLKIK